RRDRRVARRHRPRARRHRALTAPPPADPSRAIRFRAPQLRSAATPSVAAGRVHVRPARPESPGAHYPGAVFDHHQEVSGEPVDEAERLDRALGDRDWTELAPGSVVSRFPAPSCDLAVVSLGDPRHPRVVLVPGVTGSKEDFTLMLPVLAEAGYFVQSFDLAGQYESGQAGPPPGRRYDYDLFVEDLVAF